jgi:hypothetical protein
MDMGITGRLLMFMGEEFPGCIVTGNDITGDLEVFLKGGE